VKVGKEKINSRTVSYGSSYEFCFGSTRFASESSLKDVLERVKYQMGRRSGKEWVRIVEGGMMVARRQDEERTESADRNKTTFSSSKY